MDSSNAALTPGSFGSASAIPVITVDAKGRITQVTTAATSSILTVAADSGSNDEVTVGVDTLTFSGTANEIETSVTDNTITIGLPDDVTVGGNLTVNGTLNSDDITSATVNVSGDAVISGNLTVNGTQTIVNSTTVAVDDATFRVNSDGASVDAGLEANISGTIKSLLYDVSESEWTFGAENVVASSFEGNLTGDVTGTVSDISNHSTTNLSEGSNLYWTTARGNAAMDAYLTGGTGLTYTSGTFDLDDTAVSPGTYGNATAIPTFTVDQQGRLTSASTVAVATNFTFTGDSGSDTVNGGESVAFVGGTNITTTMSNNSLSVALDDDITLSGNVSAVNVTGSGTVEGGTLTDGTLSINSGSITSGVGATFSGSVSGGTLTDGTLSINSGNITSGVAATFSGAVSGGSLTDGTATLSSGALSGATTGGFSGQVTAGSFTDSTATLSGGDLTGAGNVTASGTVQFGSLSDGSISITGFVDEDNMSSDSATLVPTQQSVKAYVDASVGAATLNVDGDSGTGSIDLDSANLIVNGTANEVETSVSGGTVTIGLPNDVTVSNNLTVSGSFLSNDITSSTVNVNGDAVITGNLTVQGTQTIIESTTVQTEDAIFRVNSNGTTGANVGFEANVGGTMKQIVYIPTNAWDFGDEIVNAQDFSASGNVTATGIVSFGTLTDSGESIAITKFVDEADGIANNDNDTTIPTSAAIIDYVVNNGGDGLLLRGTFTANSSDSDFDIGTVPNVSSRTYYAEKIVIKVGTGFSGGSFNHILVKENGGSGDTIVAAVDADAATAGTYIIELDGDQTLTKNASVQVQFKQSDGTTASVVTTGSMTATVHYNYV